MGTNLLGLLDLLLGPLSILPRLLLDHLLLFLTQGTSWREDSTRQPGLGLLRIFIGVVVVVVVAVVVMVVVVVVSSDG